MTSLLGIEIPHIVVLLIALVIVWVIASIPVYIAGKLVTRGRATFGAAMGATLGGIIVYSLVVLGVTFFLGALIGPSAYIWGVILGFIAFLAVYRALFDTGWLGAIAIAIVAVVVAVVLSALLSALFGITLPPTLPHSVNI